MRQFLAGRLVLRSEAPLRRGAWARLSRETAFVILGQLGSLTGAIIGLRLLTKLVDPSVWGAVALFNTAVIFLGQVCFGPLSAWMQRNFAPYREREELRDYFGILGWLNSRCLLGILLCVLILLMMWLGGSAWALPALLTAGIAYLQGLNGQMTAIQSAGRRRVTSGLHLAGTAWLRPLAACGIVMLAGATAAGVLAGYLLALTAIFVSQLFFLGRLSPAAGLKFAGLTRTKYPSTEQLKSILWLGGPMAIWGITGWLQLSADRWVVNYYLDLSSVGILAASVTLASVPILAISGVISDLFYPIILERAGEANDSARVQRALSMFKLELVAFGLISMLWLVVAFGFRNEIVGLLDSKYQATVTYFPIMTLGWIFLGLGTEMRNLGLIFKATRRFLIPTMACSLAALLLAMVGTTEWGLIGTAGAFTLAAGLALSVMTVTAWKLVRSKRSMLQNETRLDSRKLVEIKINTSLDTKNVYALEQSSRA